MVAIYIVHCLVASVAPVAPVIQETALFYFGITMEEHEEKVEVEVTGEAAVEATVTGEAVEATVTGEEEEKVTGEVEAIPPVGRASYVYLLASSRRGATYVGATVDLDHRLRQHNQELVGGAKATGIRVQRGETWRRVLHVRGFPDWQAALQFEWRFKNLARTKAFRHAKTPLDRKLQALRHLLTLDRSTTKAVPFATWPAPPEVVWE